MRLEAKRRKFSTTDLTDGSVGVITKVLSREYVAKQELKSSDRMNRWASVQCTGLIGGLLCQQQSVLQDSTTTSKFRVPD